MLRLRCLLTNTSILIPSLQFLNFRSQTQVLGKIQLKLPRKVVSHSQSPQVMVMSIWWWKLNFLSKRHLRTRNTLMGLLGTSMIRLLTLVMTWGMLTYCLWRGMNSLRRFWGCLVEWLRTLSYRKTLSHSPGLWKSLSAVWSWGSGCKIWSGLLTPGRKILPCSTREVAKTTLRRCSKK